MTPLDWIMVLIPLGVVVSVGLYTQRYVRSVADFVSSGRVAGRYLLAIGRGEMSAGAMVFAGAFEIFHNSGFTIAWWSCISAPIALLVAITGFVIYRYRETRAMTLAQFFEIRYSKRFRVFTGFMAFVAGLVNFGVIPSVGARFISYYLGFPPTVKFLALTLPTPVLVMAVLLSVTVFVALSGGLITVLVTDCLEGIFSQVFYVVIIACLIWSFRWTDINHVLANRPHGQSLINPFDSGGLKDFNLFYVLMSLVISIYGTMAWQNRGPSNSAGLTAHENRMGNVLGHWRETGKLATIYCLAACAMTYLTLPSHAVEVAQIHHAVSQIPGGQTQEQMQLPITVSTMLPAGVKGAFLVILIMGIFGGDSMHLHSWSGLLIQDVLVPLRRKPFKPKQHVLLLRLSIVGVGFFVFCFGALMQQTDYLVMWFAATMTIFVGGAGSAIIGGLYWKKGTTAGAWAALIVGSISALVGIIGRQIYGQQFPINGVETSFFSSLLGIATYVGVSLLTNREDFNLERMLHRGKYAQVVELSPEERAIQTNARHRLFWLDRVLSYDETCTNADRWVGGGLLAWGMMWFSIFAIGSIWNLISPWPLSWWSTYWHITGFGIPIFMACVTAVWFTWGGIRDIRDLFRRLEAERSNALDDGTVVGHRNMNEAVVAGSIATAAAPSRKPATAKH